MAEAIEKIVDSYCARLENRFGELESKLLRNINPDFNNGGFRGNGHNNYDGRYSNRNQGFDRRFDRQGSFHGNSASYHNQDRGHNRGQNRGQNRGRFQGQNRGHRNDRSRGRGNGSRGRQNFNRQKSEERNQQPQPQIPQPRPTPEVRVHQSDGTVEVPPPQDPKKKIYLNPLLPRDSRLSKIWTDKEVEVFKGKFGTNAEQAYLKQFMHFNIEESHSNANRCSCELVITCIPKFFGAQYVENESHDLIEATRILKVADPNFDEHEIIHAQRHPGQENTDLDFIKVTVLFNNSQTPDRIASRAEKLRDTTMFQRSIPIHIRQRNATMDDYIINLNSLRPKNCPYLWSTALVRGEKHRIQRSDPSFVPGRVPEPEVETTTTNSGAAGAETEMTPATGLTGAAAALKLVNSKLSATGSETPMTNLPTMTVGELMADLKKKHNGNMDLVCQEILLEHGIPDKMELRKARKNSSNGRT